MWTPLGLWSHPANGFKYQKLEQSQQLRIKTNIFEMVEIGVEDGVNLGFESKDSLLPYPVIQGGTISLFNVV